MTFDKDFKQAISDLPGVEKDKLILRLLKKDLNLANRLYFELVSGVSVEQKRLDLVERIKSETERFALNYYSPGYLHVDMRYLSGEINEHVRITKDKIGEIGLQILMLTEVLQNANKQLSTETPGRRRKVVLYMIARVFKILLLLQKMHEDIRYDFKESIEKLGEIIGANDFMMRAAIHNGLDVNWLIHFEIPTDIDLIYKDLRLRGFL